MQSPHNNTTPRTLNLQQTQTASEAEALDKIDLQSKPILQKAPSIHSNLTKEQKGVGSCGSNPDKSYPPATSAPLRHLQLPKNMHNEINLKFLFKKLKIICTYSKIFATSF